MVRVPTRRIILNNVSMFDEIEWTNFAIRVAGVLSA